LFSSFPFDHLALEQTAFEGVVETRARLDAKDEVRGMMKDEIGGKTKEESQRGEARRLRFSRAPFTAG